MAEHCESKLEKQSRHWDVHFTRYIFFAFSINTQASGCSSTSVVEHL